MFFAYKMGNKRTHHVSASIKISKDRYQSTLNVTERVRYLFSSLETSNMWNPLCQHCVCTDLLSARYKKTEKYVEMMALQHHNNSCIWAWLWYPTSVHCDPEKRDEISEHTVRMFAWWRHQMETFFALLTLCEFTGPRSIPLTKASDAELWCFLSSVPE